MSGAELRSLHEAAKPLISKMQRKRISAAWLELENDHYTGTFRASLEMVPKHKAEEL